MSNNEVTPERFAALDSHDRVVEAIMVWLDRYGGLWSGDHGEVRHALSELVGCAETLASEYPDGWDSARDFVQYVWTHGQLPRP